MLSKWTMAQKSWINTVRKAKSRRPSNKEFLSKSPKSVKLRATERDHPQFLMRKDSREILLLKTLRLYFFPVFLFLYLFDTVNPNLT